MKIVRIGVNEKGWEKRIMIQLRLDFGSIWIINKNEKSEDFSLEMRKK